ncbi:MAG: sulfatase-like hydrolase/transferase [Bacteroidota bacterium]
MKLNYFLTLIIGFLLLSCGNNEEKVKPNIILIMADDLGYGDLGCYGNTEIKTPYLDRLAKGGLRFTDFHSNGAVCSPTRAALMTGLYQQRVGIEGVVYATGKTRKTGLDLSHTTMAEIFKSAGYETGIMGKWHLGYDKKYNPVHQGFDEFKGYVSGNVDYQSHYDGSLVFDWYHNLDTVPETGYSTDLIGSHSVKFLSKNRKKPFFLYIPHEAPHIPFQGRHDPAIRNPFREDPPNQLSEEEKRRAYKEMVEVMDENIGLLLLNLESMKLLENTIIFFLSDNGGYQNYANHGPLNGRKGTLYEGGHRVPAIAYWRGKIKPGESNELLMSFDLLPTLSSIANIDTDIPFDGIDFSSVLFGDKLDSKRDLFWRYRGQSAIRSGDMKLLMTKEDTLLFNLSTDLGEKKDLRSTNPDMALSLLKKYQVWDDEMNQYELVTN